MRDRTWVDPNGRGTGEEMRGVDEGVKVIRMYYIEN